MDDEIEEGAPAAQVLEALADFEFVAQGIPEAVFVTFEEGFAEVVGPFGFYGGFYGEAGRVEGVANAFAGEGVYEAGGVAQKKETVAVAFAADAAHREVPAYGFFQGPGIRKAFCKGRTVDDFLKGVFEVDVVLFDGGVEHANANVGVSVAQGEGPEVAGEGFVHKVEFDLVVQAGDVFVITTESDDGVVAVVEVAAGFSGDNGAESVAAQDEVASEF